MIIALNSDIFEFEIEGANDEDVVIEYNDTAK